VLTKNIYDSKQQKLYPEVGLEFKRKLVEPKTDNPAECDLSYKKVDYVS
jgi:hypothetical protein